MLASDNTQNRDEKPAMRIFSPTAFRSFFASILILGLCDSIDAAAEDDDILTFLPAILAAAQNASPAPTVSVLPNHSSHTDGIGNLYIVGEVKNETGSNAWFTKVTVDIKDSSGNILTTGSGFAARDMKPSEKACFAIVVTEPTNWTSYSFRDAEFSNFGPIPKLTVLNGSMSKSSNSLFTTVDVTADIKNIDSKTISLISAKTAMYNAAGTIKDCAFSLVTPDTLDAGQTASMDSSAFGDHLTDVVSYEIQTRGSYPPP